MSRRASLWSFSLGEPGSISQQLRLLGPLGFLPRAEFDHVYVPSLRALARLPRVPDIAVFQRNFYPFRESFKIAALVRRHGGKSVLDVDDLITSLPADHPSFPLYERIGPQAVELMMSVDAVTVTNARLKAHFEQYSPNIQVLPNLLDEDVWRPSEAPRPPAPGRCRLLFSGNPAHLRDLELIKPALLHALQKYGARLEMRFIGCVPEWLRGRPGVEALGIISDYRAYAGLLREDPCDAAIVPLKDEPFNLCKSNIKFLEFSACGLPGVYSDLGPYRDSISDGETGLLAPNEPDAWIAALERLIDDPALRAAIGARARAHVWENYSLREKSSLWRQFYSGLAASTARSGAVSWMPLASYGPYAAYAWLKSLL